MTEQVRNNMAMFQKSLSMFSPFQYGQAGGEAPASAGRDDVEGLKKELDVLKSRLDKLGRG